MTSDLFATTAGPLTSITSMMNLIKRRLRRNVDPLQLLQRLAPGNPQQVLIHVGAHLGQERFQYEAQGFEKILWVEGSRSVCDRLVEVIDQHQGSAQHFVECALLTDQDDEQVELLQYSNDSMSNSIFSATDRLRSRWPEVSETGEAETVRTSTLDSLLAHTEFATRCDLLVVDVQGAEMLVLNGAKKILTNTSAVICEVSTVPYYQGGALYKELATQLRSADFFPMSTPRRHGDMLFMRRELPGKLAS